jgi:hypothetical protein
MTLSDRTKVLMCNVISATIKPKRHGYPRYNHIERFRAPVRIQGKLLLGVQEFCVRGGISLTSNRKGVNSML